MYEETKLTIDELRQFKELDNLSDIELKKIADDLFDLACVAYQVVIKGT